MSNHIIINSFVENTDPTHTTNNPSVLSQNVLWGKSVTPYGGGITFLYRRYIVQYGTICFLYIYDAI